MLHEGPLWRGMSARMPTATPGSPPRPRQRIAKPSLAHVRPTQPSATFAWASACSLIRGVLRVEGFRVSSVPDNSFSKPAHRISDIMATLAVRLVAGHSCPAHRPLSRQRAGLGGRNRGVADYLSTVGHPASQCSPQSTGSVIRSGSEWRRPDRARAAFPPSIVTPRRNAHFPRALFGHTTGHMRTVEISSADRSTSLKTADRTPTAVPATAGLVLASLSPSRRSSGCVCASVRGSARNTDFTTERPRVALSLKLIIRRATLCFLFVLVGESRQRAIATCRP
jgi:hypothetical protein